MNAWVVVASADHVARGVAGGFMQANHGKRTPLKRVRPGDGAACYSPSAAFGAKDGLQSFTAIGRVAAGEPYSADMGGGFMPFRCDVAWLREAQPVAIRPLLDRLSFSAGQSNWGYVLRRGLFAIEEADFDLIAASMGVAG